MRRTGCLSPTRVCGGMIVGKIHHTLSKRLRGECKPRTHERISLSAVRDIMPGKRPLPARGLDGRILAGEGGDVLGRIDVVAHAHDLLVLVERPQVQLFVTRAAATQRRKLNHDLDRHLALTR
jgi:hypothetical protein